MDSGNLLAHSSPSIASTVATYMPVEPRRTKYREVLVKLPPGTPHSHAFVVDEASAMAPEQSESGIQQRGVC